MELPPRLYRYRDTGNYTESVFSNQELYFSKPASFNDPFDCGFRFLIKGDPNHQVIAATAFKVARRVHPDWSLKQSCEAADRVAATIVGNHEEEACRKLQASFAREHNDRAGIVCMAETESEILMWSHYADHHRGICLEFRTDIAHSIFAKAQPVTYSDEYPHLDLRTIVEDKQIRTAAAWMLTKSRQWSYEREWRILDFEHGAGARPFPPECLSGVILGCRIPDHEREKVLAWVRGYPTPVTIREAKQSSSHFRLDISKVIEFS